MRRKIKCSAKNKFITGSDGTGKSPSFKMSHRLKSSRKRNRFAAPNDYELELNTSTTAGLTTIDNINMD